MTHWKIRSVIREVESASLCNNSAPDDSSCLKIRLEDAKVHQVILLKSKICMLSQKRVLKIIHGKMGQDQLTRAEMMEEVIH